MIALLVAIALLPAAPRDGFILDEVGVLSPGAVVTLNRQIKALSDRGVGQIGILLTDDLRGKSRNELSPEVFRAWGIGYGDRGPTGKGRGVLILAKVHPPDRGVRVEVGRDLEGRLNDGKVGAITRDVIPDFIADRWFDGLGKMVMAIGFEMTVEAADVAAPIRPAMVERDETAWWLWISIAVAVLAAGGVLLYVRRKRRLSAAEPQAPIGFVPSASYDSAPTYVPTYAPPVYAAPPVVIVESPVVVQRAYEPSPSYEPPSSSDSGSSWDSGSSSSGGDSGGGFGGGGDSGGGGSDSSF